ncbi:MAG: dihydroorotate dehydrogenase-like protein [Verrucomicrobia bacterium]|jgi:dihydroorotate dehydrogenase (fumarate)|nr:dihydroorotate dehydrogenase-like protein [Verrucomicrobiota bacterium]
MNLATSYLGLELPHPLIVGSSPLANDEDLLRTTAQAGAAAIVVHSLFQEQILREERDAVDFEESMGIYSPEALSFFPKTEAYYNQPDEYLRKIKTIKESVDIPVIGSLNGTTPGNWLRYAGLIEEAGADALELTIYTIPTDPTVDGAAVEQMAYDMVAEARKALRIPLTVKIGPVYSSLPHFARKLDQLGIDGLVLFNRFFHPDIDVESLEVERRLVLTRPTDLLFRLRWLAILSACEHRYDLAVNGGVTSGLDAIKAIMCGADAVQLVSALLAKGPQRLAEIREEMSRWMEENGYESLRQMKGSMDLRHCPEASAFERANYVHILQNWDRDPSAMPRA